MVQYLTNLESLLGDPPLPTFKTLAKVNFINIFFEWGMFFNIQTKWKDRTKSGTEQGGTQPGGSKAPVWPFRAYRCGRFSLIGVVASHTGLHRFQRSCLKNITTIGVRLKAAPWFTTINQYNNQKNGYEKFITHITVPAGRALCSHCAGNPARRCTGH